MLNEIYNRNPQDPNYTPDQLEMDDTLEMFKQQIESVLFTPKTSVLGNVDFGASLEEYIWSFRTSADDLNYAITNQISAYCSLAGEFPYTIDTKFYAGTIRDIAEISIIIDNREKFNVLVA
tara:strand:+ start:180 stop:542 length:363 start_codon:yes stop_codon:yes gene_type:complete